MNGRNTADTTFSGTLALTISSLTKTGDYKLTLSGTNYIAGRTIVSEGTLAIASQSNIGSGTLTLNGGTLQATANITGLALSLTANSTLDPNGNTITLTSITPNGHTLTIANTNGGTVTRNGVALTGTIDFLPDFDLSKNNITLTAGSAITNYNLPAPTSYGDTVAYSMTSGAIKGLTFNTDGTYSGTPSEIGTKNIIYTATANGNKTSNTFTITVNSPSPVLKAQTTDKTVNAGSTITTIYLPPVVSTYGDTVTYALVSGTIPAGLSFSTKDASISGKPTGSGDSTLQYRATISGGTVTSNAFKITVNPPSPLSFPTPILNTFALLANTMLTGVPLPKVSGGTGAFTYSFVDNTNNTLTATNNTYELEHGTINFTGSSLLNGVQTIVNSKFNYTPAQNFIGQDYVTYNLSDTNYVANNTLSTQIAMTVKPTPISIVYGQSITNQTLTYHSGGSAPYSYTLVDLPNNGSVSMNSPMFSYTPQAGFAGTDTFTFKITNSTTPTPQQSDLHTMTLITNQIGDLSGKNLAISEIDFANLTNNITNSGINSTLTITINQTSQTIASTIQNNIALVKNGSAALFLTGTNTYTSGTTITAGTLAINASAAVGSGDITLTGGTLQAQNSLNMNNNNKVININVVLNSSININNFNIENAVIYLSAQSQLNIYNGAVNDGQ